MPMAQPEDITGNLNLIKGAPLSSPALYSTSVSIMANSYGGTQASGSSGYGSPGNAISSISSAPLALRDVETAHLVKCPYTEKQRAEAWDSCATTVKNHSDEMLKRWEDEINMLLTFAGLFSAALTAFNVQSYLLLQPDSGDVAVAALAHISEQLTSFSVNQAFVNSTRPAFLPPDGSSFAPPRYAIWINALWFPSLICTLSASSIAVTVKQWLYQYKQGLSGTSREISRLRQYRYENLLNWRVPEIIVVLPILLQIALSLFLGGLLILLWSLHPLVATIASALVGTLGFFHFVTTLLPTFRPDCSYQSPQALGIFLILQPVRKFFIRASKTAAPYFSLSSRSLALLNGSLAFLSKTFRALIPKRGTHRSSWHAREKAAAHARRTDLDRGLVMTAYDVTLIENVLHTSLGPCMWDMQPGCIRRCYDDVFGKRLKPLPWPSKDDWGPAAPLVLNFSLLAARDGRKIPHSVLLHETVLEMPTPDVSADSELGGLFVQTTSHLVLRDAWTRRAFDKLVWYLYMTGIKEDVALRPEVIHDVIAAFPKSLKSFRKVIDHENTHLNVPYLSVAEGMLRYLGHHKPVSPEDVFGVEKNIQDMTLAVLTFLRFPAWKGKRSRLQYVLWELHDSGILLSISRIREDPLTRELVTPRLVRAFRTLLTSIDEDLLCDSWLREFWKDKYDSVVSALGRLEGLFGEGELEVQHMDGDMLDLYPEHDDTRRFTPSTAVFPAETAAPGKLAAYPAFSWAEDHLADALPPVVAFPGEMTCPPMSEAGSGRLLAVPLSLVATPSSLCTAPLQLESEPSVLLDRREWYRQRNMTTDTQR